MPSLSTYEICTVDSLINEKCGSVCKSDLQTSAECECCIGSEILQGTISTEYSVSYTTVDDYVLTPSSRDACFKDEFDPD